MSRYEIPLWVKVVFWTIYWGAFLAWGLGPLLTGPVDPPVWP